MMKAIAAQQQLICKLAIEISNDSHPIALLVCSERLDIPHIVLLTRTKSRLPARQGIGYFKKGNSYGICIKKAPNDPSLQCRLVLDMKNKIKAFSRIRMVDNLVTPDETFPPIARCRAGWPLEMSIQST
jgi:hypothetical protein